MSDVLTDKAPSRSEGPLMATRHIRLRVIADGDSEFIYQLMTSPYAGGRVRFAGATPSPDKIAASLWDSVLAQFIVEGLQQRKQLGLVAITSPNFRDGFAYLSVVGSPKAQGVGLVAEAALLCFHYAFTTWPLRKIYMESTEESYKGFSSGLNRFFQEEGRLRQHSFWNGTYMDLLILAVYRETWAHHAPRMLKRLCRG